MIDSLDDAVQIASDARRLAVFLSTATQIEPALLRAVRLRMVPDADVGIESAFWFSDLISGRSADAVTLRPALLPQLRRELRQVLTSADSRHRVHELGAVINRTHLHLTPAIRLEEEINWLAVSDPDGLPLALDGILDPALRALVEERRAGIGEWFVTAQERLPDEVRSCRSGWLIAHAIRSADAPDLQERFEPPPSIDTTDVELICDLIEDVPLPVRFEAGELVLGGPILPETMNLLVPETQPRIIRILEPAPERILVVHAGGVTREPVDGRRVLLLTGRGALYSIEQATGGVSGGPLKDGPRAVLAAIGLDLDPILREMERLSAEFVSAHEPPARAPAGFLVELAPSVLDALGPHSGAVATDLASALDEFFDGIGLPARPARIFVTDGTSLDPTDFRVTLIDLESTSLRDRVLARFRERSAYEPTESSEVAHVDILRALLDHSLSERRSFDDAVGAPRIPNFYRVAVDSWTLLIIQRGIDATSAEFGRSIHEFGVWNDLLRLDERILVELYGDPVYDLSSSGSYLRIDSEFRIDLENAPPSIDDTVELFTAELVLESGDRMALGYDRTDIRLGFGGRGIGASSSSAETVAVVFRSPRQATISATSAGAPVFVNNRFVRSQVLVPGDFVQLGSVVARFVQAGSHVVPARFPRPVRLQGFGTILRPSDRYLRLPTGECYVLDRDQFVVGSGQQADLWLQDEWLSERHALLDVSDDLVSVTNLSPANGILVNGRLVERATLDDSDRVAMGGLEFTFRVGLPPPAEVLSPEPRPPIPLASFYGGSGVDGHRFRRRSTRRGYKVEEVDAFLNRVEATLRRDRAQHWVRAQEVHDVVFRVRFGGYDEWQVDLHMDRVERALGEMEMRDE